MTRQNRLHIDALEDRSLPSFLAPVSYDAGGYPQAVLAADFNNDTIQDLAVASGNSVGVLLGNGDGTFASVVTSAVGGHSITVGDFDGDGNLDLASANFSGVGVLLGNGDGTFAAPSNIDFTGLGSSPASVAVGDFNGDGLLDLGVTSNLYVYDGYAPYYGYAYYHYEGYASVLVGNGSGGFSEPNTTWLGYGYRTSSVAADFNGDAIDDFATVNSDYSTVGVLLGDAGGFLQGPTDFYAGYYPTAVAAADVNGDGAADLVTANYYGSGVSVLLGDGAGGFGGPQNYAAGSSPQSVALADFNGDDALDIVTASNTYTGVYTGEINVFLGYGDGTFASPISQTLAAGTYATGLAAADFDGDGLPDVAVANSDADSGEVSVLLNAGGWAFPATLAISDVTVTEGDGGTVAAVFTVTRGGNLDGTVTVNYGTANGGALAGSDYVAASGTLTFGPGETTKTITILVNGDSTDEYDQAFLVNLSAASGASVSVTDGQGVGTIVDNDPPPTVTITRVSLKEGNNNRTTTFNFIVTLSAASEKEIQVSFATANGTATTAGGDYFARSGTLVFAPGQTSKSIPVVVRGDKNKEPNETFFVNLTGATNATIEGPQGVGEILDDDGPSKGGRP
jgi:hypothetical protein